MANLYFPQLSTGAIAQYPIRKFRLTRTIKNVLPDGNMILFSDPSGGRLIWELSYTSLPVVDLEAIQAHFDACLGPFRAFTFIDPTENMLLSSSDLRAPVWQSSSLMDIVPGAGDPEGGSAAFVVTNTSQASQEISQPMTLPSNYQYCFSVYAASAGASALTLVRRGDSTEERTSIPISGTWRRIVSSGQLNDPGTEFLVSISLEPGQQVQVYGPQVEAQLAPSRYRPTTQRSGVFSNAHWAVDQLTVVAEAPNLFSTSFCIETAI